MADYAFNSTNIPWSTIPPGSRVLIRAGVHTAPLDVSVRDIIVEFEAGSILRGNIMIGQPEVAIYGNGLIVELIGRGQPGSRTYPVHIMQSAPGALFHGIEFIGKYDSTTGLGAGVLGFADFALEKCRFEKSPGEDQIGGVGCSVRLTDCICEDMVPDSTGRAHRDVCAVVIPPGKALVVERSIFRRLSVDCLFGQYGSVLNAPHGAFIFMDNVFDGNMSAIKMDSRQGSVELVTIRRNMFLNCKAQVMSQQHYAKLTSTGNIFSGAYQGSNGPKPVNYNTGERDSYWRTGTMTYVEDPSNERGPLVYDPGTYRILNPEAAGYGPSHLQYQAPAPPEPKVVYELLDNNTWRAA